MTGSDFWNVSAIVIDQPDAVERHMEYLKQYTAEAAGFVGDMIVQHPNEFITAVATCVVAAFTIVLARSTTRLWESAKVQSDDFKQSVAAAVTSNQIAVTNAQQQLRAYVNARDLNLVTHRGPGRM